jgi:hypothetical protein
MRGDLVRLDIDVKVPCGYGMTPEQINHLLIGRCQIFGLEVVASATSTIGIYNEEEPSEAG